MSATVKIDIWSDIACPWCYVGKRRLESAVNDFDGDVEIEYHSFELSPDTPVGYSGTEAEFLATHKGMPVAQAQQMLSQMTTIAADEGLTYDFDALRHANTVLAHQLLHLAKAHNQQVAMKERLLKAYFEQGRDLNRIEVLTELAAELGLDASEVTEALTSQRYLDAVRADQKQAVDYGINGVPFFVFDNRLAVSGAQKPEVFLSALQQASGTAGVSA